MTDSEGPGSPSPSPRGTDGRSSRLALGCLLIGLLIGPEIGGHPDAAVTRLAWLPEAIQALVGGDTEAFDPLRAVIIPAVGAAWLVTDALHLAAVLAVIALAGRSVAARLGSLRIFALIVFSGALSGGVGAIVRLGEPDLARHLVGASTIAWTLIGSALLLEARTRSGRGGLIGLMLFGAYQVLRPEPSLWPTTGEELPVAAQLTALIGAPLWLPFFLPPPGGRSR